MHARGAYRHTRSRQNRRSWEADSACSNANPMKSKPKLSSRAPTSTAKSPVCLRTTNVMAAHPVLSTSISKISMTLRGAHGKSVANAAVREISDILMKQVRGSDIVGRLAPDEFGVLLMRCDNENAWKKANFFPMRCMKNWWRFTVAS